VYTRKHDTTAVLLLTGLAGIAGCAPKSSVSPPVAQSYQLTATVQDLMEGIVDPSADTLWDSVAYIASARGVEDRQPRTDEEWQKVRYAAVTLIEAGNLLSMPGRTVAKDASAGSAGAAPANVGTGELTHGEIQSRINASHVAFTQFARNLQTAGMKALAAIEAKDAAALMDAGGVIDEACEACHVTYWYPNQNRPGG
jgi:hypothetical protein